MLTCISKLWKQFNFKTNSLFKVHFKVHYSGPHLTLTFLKKMYWQSIVGGHCRVRCNMIFFWSYLLHCDISSMYLIILVTRTENNLWSSTSSSQEWQMRCSKVFQSLIHHGISQSWCKHAREASKELVAVLLLTQSGKINKNVLFSDVF